MALLLGVGMILGLPGRHRRRSACSARSRCCWCSRCAFSWMSVLVGMLVSEPEKVQIFGFAVMFPLTFASNAFVPAATMPGWLQALGRGQPGHDPGRRRPRAAGRRPGRRPRWPVAALGGRASLVVFAPLAVRALPAAGARRPRPASPARVDRRWPVAATRRTASANTSSPSSARVAARHAHAVDVRHDGPRTPRTATPRRAAPRPRAGRRGAARRSATPTSTCAITGASLDASASSSASACSARGRVQVALAAARSAARRGDHRAELRRRRAVARHRAGPACSSARASVQVAVGGGRSSPAACATPAIDSGSPARSASRLASASTVGASSWSPSQDSIAGQPQSVAAPGPRSVTELARTARRPPGTLDRLGELAAPAPAGRPASTARTTSPSARRPPGRPRAPRGSRPRPGRAAGPR